MKFQILLLSLCILFAKQIISQEALKQEVCERNSVDCHLENMSEEELKIFKRLEMTENDMKLALNPTYTDLWGAQINWTESQNGWFPLKRYQHINATKDIHKRQKSIKTFTKKGFKVMDIPSIVYKTILQELDYESMHLELCEVQKVASLNCLKKMPNGTFENMNNYYKIDFVNEKVVTNVLSSAMIPIIEKWGKIAVSGKFTVYGIRRYTRGAFLLQHVDRLPTHILSAILQV